LRRVLAHRKTRQLCGALVGDELTRAPKGFDPDHEAMDLIRKKDWLLDVTLDASLATTPDLYNEIAARFRLMHPFVEFFRPAAKAVVKKPVFD